MSQNRLQLTLVSIIIVLLSCVGAPVTVTATATATANGILDHGLGFSNRRLTKACNNDPNKTVVIIDLRETCYEPIQQHASDDSRMNLTEYSSFIQSVVDEDSCYHGIEVTNDIIKSTFWHLACETCPLAYNNSGVCAPCQDDSESLGQLLAAEDDGGSAFLPIPMSNYFELTPRDLKFLFNVCSRTVQTIQKQFTAVPSASPSSSPSSSWPQTEINFTIGVLDPEGTNITDLVQGPWDDLAEDIVTDVAGELGIDLPEGDDLSDGIISLITVMEEKSCEEFFNDIDGQVCYDANVIVMFRIDPINEHDSLNEGNFLDRFDAEMKEAINNGGLQDCDDPANSCIFRSTIDVTITFKVPESSTYLIMGSAGALFLGVAGCCACAGYRDRDKDKDKMRLIPLPLECPEFDDEIPEVETQSKYY